MAGRTLPFSPEAGPWWKKALQLACIFGPEVLFVTKRLHRADEPWGREGYDLRELICLKWQNGSYTMFRSWPCCLPKRNKENITVVSGSLAQFHTINLRHHLLVLQLHLPTASWTLSVHLALFPLQNSSPFSLLHGSTSQLLLWWANSGCSLGSFSPWSDVVHSDNECHSLSGPLAFCMPSQAKVHDKFGICAIGLGTITKHFSVRV